MPFVPKTTGVKLLTWQPLEYKQVIIGCNKMKLLPDLSCFLWHGAAYMLQCTEHMNI